MRFPIRDDWQREVVVIRPPAGRLRFLVDVIRETCPLCTTGVRTTSLWGTATGYLEEIAWCDHCFNATVYPVPQAAVPRARFEAAREAFLARTPARIWDGARPALADLDRRGLL